MCTVSQCCMYHGCLCAEEFLPLTSVQQLASGSGCFKGAEGSHDQTYSCTDCSSLSAQLAYRAVRYSCISCLPRLDLAQLAHRAVWGAQGPVTSLPQQVPGAACQRPARQRGGVHPAAALRLGPLLLQEAGCRHARPLPHPPGLSIPLGPHDVLQINCTSSASINVVRDDITSNSLVSTQTICRC